MSFRSLVQAISGRVVALTRRTGGMDDTDQRIRLVRAKLTRLAANSPERAPLLNNLGNRLRDRYLRTGDLADLEGSIECYRRCIDLAALPEVANLASGNLAVALVDRYTHLGDLENLEAGIQAGRAAAANSPTGSLDQAGHLGNLSHALHERYHRTRGLGDLQEAITVAEDALRLAPRGSKAHVAAMVNLATGLFERNAGDSSGSDLDRALELFETALAMPAGSPMHARIHAGLSSARLLRLRQTTGPETTIDETRSIAELRAVVSSPANATWRHASLHTIGTTLWRQYQRNNDATTLEAAIEAFEAAVASSPDGAGELPRYLNDLGIALSGRSFVSGSFSGLAQALSAWIRALNLLDTGFASVPVAYKLGQQRLSVNLGIAERAVATYLILADAIASQTGRERARRNAMSVAEATKSRLLTELIGRGDLPGRSGVPAQLVAREHVLFAELRGIDTAELVDHGEATNVMKADAGGRLARRAALRRELEAVWTTMTAANPDALHYVTLRRGQPLNWDTLAGLARRLGPQTALLSMFMTNSRTLMFVFRSGQDAPVVCEVAMDGPGWLDILRRFEREVRLGSGRRAETWDAPLRPLLEAVRPHLDGVERVVLAPQGWALQLPWSVVAARAGWRGSAGNVLPLVTVESLGLLPLLLDRPRAVPRPAVVVGNPGGDLLHAEAEAVKIAAMFGVSPLLGPAATKARVLQDLRHASIAHLAAHARFASGSPLDSGVVLFDGVLTAREILAESIQLDLLVLSGCETGVAESVGGHEFAGLTQAFLQAGVRCLVVSLWKVDDPGTATMMASFYERWQAGSDLARALSEAARPEASATGSARTASGDAFVLSGDWSATWPVVAPR